MNRIALSATIGIAAALVLAAAYFAAPYTGIHIGASEAMVLAGVLAFGASTSAFLLVALQKPEKRKPFRSTRINEAPAKEFTFPLLETGGVNLVVRPDTAIEFLDVVKNPGSYLDKPVLLTLKKGAGKAMFNPVVLKQLFKTLAPFKNFLHIVLTNEHDEFIGYIPAAFAKTKFTGAGAETAISENIVSVLADPATSEVLRKIGGVSSSDTITDNEMLSDAAIKTFGGLIPGLVILRHGRNRKPVGVIFKDDLYKAAAYGDEPG